MIRFSLVFLALLLLLGAPGCSGNDAKPMADEQANVKNLAIFYGKFMSQHRGQGPRNLQEFKDFIAKESAGPNATLKPGNADQMFTSPRDNQPYMVVFNPPAGAAMGGRTAVVYEQTGKDGKRYVGFSLGQVEELDQAAFEAAVPTAKK